MAYARLRNAPTPMRGENDVCRFAKIARRVGQCAVEIEEDRCACHVNSAKIRRSLSRMVCRNWQASPGGLPRSEEHTSELQSLMRISYAVFCLKKKKHTAQ